MKVKQTITCSLVTLCLVWVNYPAQGGVVESRFSSSAEGWSVVEFPAPPYDSIVAGPYAPIYSATGGNPGGMIATTDLGGTLFAFSAPSMFLGDQSSLYGGSLSFDLRFAGSGLTPGSVHPDVVLSGGGLTLVVDVGADPSLLTDSWSTYSVALTQSAGWRIDHLAGAIPSEIQLHTAISALSGLYIRGDYWSGYETTSLDNVIAEPIPAPTSLWLLLSGLGMVFGVRRRNRFEHARETDDSHKHPSPGGMP